MKRKIQISIRTRFNLFLVAIISIFILLVFFFAFYFNTIQKYRDYNNNIDDAMIEYLKIRKNEQHFMLRFTEDLNFFSTGENKYLSRHDDSFKELNLITEKLYANEISKDLEIRTNIKKVNSHIEK